MITGYWKTSSLYPLGLAGSSVWHGMFAGSLDSTILVSTILLLSCATLPADSNPSGPSPIPNSSQHHTCINYSSSIMCDTASRFQSIRPGSHPKVLPQSLLIIWISGGPLNLLSLLPRDSSLQCASDSLDHQILPVHFCTTQCRYLTVQQVCFLINLPITRVQYLSFLNVSNAWAPRNLYTFENYKYALFILPLQLTPVKGTLLIKSPDR